MGGKGLVKKLKLGLTGLAIAGFNYFNSSNANAQTNGDYPLEYNTTTRYIMKNIQKEGPYINLKTLDSIIDESKIVVKENYFGDPYDTENAKLLMKELGSIISKKIPIHKESHPCYIRGLTYLAMAEVNDLPLYPAMTPTHLFLRWDPDGIHKMYWIEVTKENESYLSTKENPSSNKADFNWDPNSLESSEDYIYRYNFNCDGKFGWKEVVEGVYLKNLDKKELLSVVYAEEGFHSFLKEKYNEALKAFDKSLELNSKNISSLEYKGKTLYRLGKNCESNCERYFERSIENFKKAGELSEKWNSIQSKYSIEIAWALKRLGRYEEAEKEFNKIISDNIAKLTKKEISKLRENYGVELYSEDKEYILERAFFYILTSQDEKARNDLIMHQNLNGRDITEHSNKMVHILPNELRGQGNNWNYTKEQCQAKNAVDSTITIGDHWRLPTIDELETIKNTPIIKNSFGDYLWSLNENGKKSNCERYGNWKRI